MSSTTEDKAVKEPREDKRDSAQRKLVRTAPPLANLTALPPEELKYLQAEMRLG